MIKATLSCGFYHMPSQSTVWETVLWDRRPCEIFLERSEQKYPQGKSKWDFDLKVANNFLRLRQPEQDP